MLFLLSPAKSLDFDSPMPSGLEPTAPLFTAQSRELIALLRAYSPQQLAELMSLSDALAQLNVARYAAWSARHSARNAKAAVLAFNGDVYDGLAASTLRAKELQWLQDHVCILSGLYGVLRPLDLMQPYRLEMGTALPNAQGKDLYAYWGSRIAEYLNSRLSGQRAPVVVNLASQEYFKSVQKKVLKARVIECVFEDEKAGQYKVISFYAKRARGTMARWAAERRVAHPEKLIEFDRNGYAHHAVSSSPDKLVFRRPASKVNA